MEHRTNLTRRQISLWWKVFLAGPGPNIRPLFDRPVILPTPYSLYKLLRMKIRPHRILMKLLLPHERNRLLDCIEVINLSLDHVSIRINIVHARRRTVIHNPDRPNAHLLLLLVGISELAERLIPECGVAQTDDWTAVCGTRDGVFAWCDADAMVLFIVGDERDGLGDVGGETTGEIDVPFYHFLVVFRFRSKDEVAQIRGFYSTCGGFEANE